MKLVILMYLEDDERAVQALLAAHGVRDYSALPLQGFGAGARGWYGDVRPYRSRMAFSVVPEVGARALVDAVRRCDACEDPRHPIHAIQIDVEDAASSGVPGPSTGDSRGEA